jgi:hypothetical protein
MKLFTITMSENFACLIIHFPEICLAMGFLNISNGIKMEF